jgi:hypothetical protein
VKRGNARIGKKCQVIQCKEICESEVGLEDERLKETSLIMYPMTTSSVKLFRFEPNPSTASQ